MTLIPQPTGPQNWRWYQQQCSQDYGMMETQPHMVYGPRPVHPAHPASVPVYMAHYSSASGQPLAHPQYQLPSPCVPYPSPSHMAAAQVHFHHRYDAPAMAQDDNSHRSLHNEDGKQCFEDFSFPMSPASSVVSVPDQSLKAKTIVANMPKDSKDVVQFNTNVDQLMKTIQADEENMEDQQQLCTPAPSPRSELESGRSTPAMPVASSSGNARVKKYVCQGPNCNKKFSQKTHLEIHSRTHSGLKPYPCKFEGCNRTFSQRGNRKTHMRRHTGDKPFECTICGKRFAQRGNVRSHEDTHRGVKPFVCILENCNKQFSQRGNMKTHQNAFHKEVLEDLTAKFAKFTTEGHIPDEYYILFEYFKLHYKNSNKGIKGRGKDRKIGGKETKVAPKSVAGRSTASRRDFYEPATPMSQPQSPVSSPMYSMASSPDSMINSVSSNGTVDSYSPMYPINNNAEHMIYNDGQARHMPFSERLY